MTHCRYQRPSTAPTLGELEARMLAQDALELLDEFCRAQAPDGHGCPLWPDPTIQCRLRDLEDRARELGIEVDK